jgi:hypothetical protein
MNNDRTHPLGIINLGIKNLNQQHVRLAIITNLHIFPSLLEKTPPRVFHSAVPYLILKGKKRET